MTNQPVKRSQTLRLVFLTLVNDRVARTLIICILPYIVVRFHLSGLMLGLILASITLTSAVSAPIAGRLSDRCGRRPILLGCLGISTLGMSIFGFASIVPALFAGRLVDGLGGGSEATSEAVIADITPRKDQTKTFGLVAMASAVGLIVGPGLGGLFASLNVRLPVWIASFMLFINVILIAAGFQETRCSDSPKQPLTQRDRSWPKLVGLAYSCLMMAGYGGLYAASLMLHDVHKVNVSTAGFVFSVAGVLSVLQQWLILPRLSRHFSDHGIFRIGCCLTISGAALIWAVRIPSSYVITVVGVSLMSMGLALISASVCSLFARGSSSGEAMGRLQLLKNIGIGIGPPLLGYAFDVALRGAFMLVFLLGLVGLVLALMAPKQPQVGTLVSAP